MASAEAAATEALESSVTTTSTATSDSSTPSPESEPTIATITAEEILIKNGKPLAKCLPPHHVLRKSITLGERIQGGRTILKLCNLVKPDEIELLKNSAVQTADEKLRILRERKMQQEQQMELKDGNKDGEDNGDNDVDSIHLEQGSPAKVLVRMLPQSTAKRENAPPEDVLPDDTSQLMERILERALTYLDNSDEICSSLRTTLFGDDCESIAELFRSQQLQFSSREPAINVYYPPNGHFAMHKDHHALSILIPLSSSDDEFKGGGTAFWNQSHPIENMDLPSIILKPPPGTALLWGGRVSHKGMKITQGRRVVMVASFSGPQGLPQDPTERLSAGFGIRTILSGR